MSTTPISHWPTLPTLPCSLSSRSDHSVRNPATSSLLTPYSAWLTKWWVQVNERKSAHVTFALGRGDCPSVTFNATTLPKSDCAKYLGLYLGRRMTRRHRITQKRKQGNLIFGKLFWLLERRSRLEHRRQAFTAQGNNKSNLALRHSTLGIRA